MNFTWLLGFTMGLIGIFGHFTYIRMVSEYNYWLLLAGFLLLVLNGGKK